MAVLVSDREFKRLEAASAPRQDFLQFLQGWRREMIAKGLPFATDEELSGLRDRLQDWLDD